MEAEITREKLRAGRGQDPDPQPLRLTGSPVPHRRAPHLPDDRVSRRRGPDRARTAGARPQARRRRGERRAIAASVLAVLALTGCVMAILMLATEPTAARLEREISSLSRRLGADQSRLTALQAGVQRTNAHGAVLARRLGQLTGRLHGLERTVHGLQGAAAIARNQAVGLRVCVPQLQRELTSLVLRTRTVRGRVTSVGLRHLMLLSAPCRALFSGL